MRIKIQKRSFILTFVLVFQLFSSTIFAQIPQKMSYQAVIRDASKALVTNKTIGMRVRIAQGTQSGTIVYTETFSPTTNINGLVSLEIGGAAGFSAINWANGPYFILTDADLTGGSSYTISGYSQLVSVPYALHAKTAESLSGGIIMPSGNTLPTPVSATGSFFFKTDENILYVSNGTAWLPLSTHGSTPSGTIFPVPTNPGDVFFNTANKNFYYWDGTSWKLVSNIPSGITLPSVASSVVGDPFFKTDTNSLYIFNGTSWNLINGLSSTLAQGSLFVGNAANIATPTTKANIPLSGFGAATADVSLGSKNITNLATPLIDADAANKAYVDSKSSTTPTGPTLPVVVGAAGNTFFNTTDKVLYISDGTKWLAVATDGSTPSGPTFPPLPSPGDVFYNTATNSYYYYDGTSWKLAASIPTGTTLPLSATTGDPFFKTDTNTLYLYINGAWTVAGLSNILANGSFFVGNAANIATATTKTNIPLSGFGDPTTSVSMGTQKITNVAAPTADPDAANKAYVDSKASTTPTGPTLPAVVGAAGNTFFNTTDKVLYISDGTKWLPVATDGSTPSGPTFPPLPSPGDVFYNTASNNYYYYDGTSWKVASTIPTGITVPLTGTAGDPFFKTDTNTLYIYSNGAWNVAGLSNTLANGSFFVGNASNIATPTTKSNIALSGFGVPTTDVSMGTQKLINLLTPTVGTDAANKAYVDAKTASTPSGPTNPPAAGANVGDVFYNTTTKSFYYFDGTNWKIISGVSVGTTNPPTGLPGETFYNTTTNTFYVYDNGTWNPTKVQANWTQNTATADDYIKNKPTRLSQFTNDAGYLTSLGVPSAETDPVWNLVKADYYTSLQLSSNFPGSASVHWRNITSTPTTLLGYGITDAASSSHNHAIDGLSNVTITSKANNDILQWNNVLGKWVNKSFVTAVVQAETDPIVSAINGIVKSDGTNISGALAGTDYVAPNSAITGATKTKITYDSKGLVTAGTDATTADIASSTNKRYVTDSQLNVLNNTSGTNTGDQTALQVSVTPAGNISSTNVQNALVELQGDINTINTSSHAAVTLGTANGLSLTGQQLSMAPAAPGSSGAMSAADKTKLDGIAAGAEVNVQADWNQATNTADDYIKNKPTAVSIFNNDAGYLTAGTLSASEQDPIWNAAKGNYYTALQLSTKFAGSASVEWLNIINTPTTLAGYGITNAMSTAHAANGITAGNITNWNAAFGWGNHNLMGYVTGVTATGPIFSSGGTTPDISISKANATTAGYLSAADWNTFNNKESSLAAGTTSQYYRGDKTWQTLDKAAVGLANVDNTTDLNKPISTATQGALDLKENVGNKSTNTALGNSDLLYPTQNAVKSYVDTQITNATPDATTLVKGKVQLAGDLGGTAALPSVLKINGAALGTTTTTDANILVANSATSKWESVGMSGDVKIANTGLATIQPDAVTTGKIANANVTTAKIADANVTASKLTAGAGTAGRVAVADVAGAVTYGNIPSSSINGANLTSTDLTVTGGTGATLTTVSLAITDNAITNSKMADNAVGTVELTDNAVTTPKIANANVTTVKIADLNVTAGKLTAGAGTDGRVAIANAAGAVTYGNIPSSSVNGSNLTSTDLVVTGGTGATLVPSSLAIADGAVTTAKIANGTILNEDLNKTNIPISGFGAATADVSLGSKKITDLAAPTKCYRCSEQELC